MGWNSLNTYLVNTAKSRALAMLEGSVHLDLSEDLLTDRFYVEIDIPEDVTILELNSEDLPGNWNAKPPTLATQYIGDDFVADAQAAVLLAHSLIFANMPLGLLRLISAKCELFKNNLSQKASPIKK